MNHYDGPESNLEFASGITLGYDEKADRFLLSAGDTTISLPGPCGQKLFNALGDLVFRRIVAKEDYEDEVRGSHSR